MPRPIRCRRIERLPVYRSFSPDDITAAESVQMTVDEFEALRLLDDEGLTQEACAARMNIARPPSHRFTTAQEKRSRMPWFMGNGC